MNTTRIGLVCEGETDRIAIEWFVRSSLVDRGFSGDISFCKIQDYKDQTSRDIHGYTMVLAWLRQGPTARARLFGGMFAGDSERLDAIVVHLDADNLSSMEFRTHVLRFYDMTVKNHRIPAKRGFAIRTLLTGVGGLGCSSGLYALAVAVESTESWCVAAFGTTVDPESLKGPTLNAQFMHVMLKAERQPPQVIKEATKDPIRWERLCRRAKPTHVRRLERRCSHYEKLVHDVVRVLKTEVPSTDV